MPFPIITYVVLHEAGARKDSIDICAQPSPFLVLRALEHVADHMHMG